MYLSWLNGNSGLDHCKCMTNGQWLSWNLHDKLDYWCSLSKHLSSLHPDTDRIINDFYVNLKHLLSTFFANSEKQNKKLLSSIQNKLDVIFIALFLHVHSLFIRFHSIGHKIDTFDKNWWLLFLKLLVSPMHKGTKHFSCSRRDKPQNTSICLHFMSI